jgi:hypothetical protein
MEGHAWGSEQQTRHLPKHLSIKAEVIELPSWIRTSEFVEQIEIDFRGQPIELLIERNFPFPTKSMKETLNRYLTMFDSLV